VVSLRDDDLSTLKNIIDCCRIITDHLEQGGLHALIVRDAVSMRLIQIGESVSGLSAPFRASHTELPVERIVGMRHRLAHAYLELDLSRLTDVVENHIPVLARLAEEILEQLD
jgi:uncharacterized protein with HEPN domain